MDVDAELRFAVQHFGIAQPQSYWLARTVWPLWTPLYQAVSHSPIKVAEIDCRDQANLIMKTELGIVHFGSYSSQLVEQLNILAQMRQISTRLNASQIVYINLKNPKHPSVQTNQTSNTVKSDTQ
jgi:cell division protein FtsQ